MKRKLAVFFLAVTLGLVAVLGVKNSFDKTKLMKIGFREERAVIVEPGISEGASGKNIEEESANESAVNKKENSETKSETKTETGGMLDEVAESEEAEFSLPIVQAGERVTRKPFGIFVTPQNSPVSPERFSGYHLGADFEIFPEEIDQNVEIRAVCTGEISAKRQASGYGGLVVQECRLDGMPTTIIYGHLALNSVSAVVGSNIAAGDILGVLGKDKSAETDGERKHLHLAFHKGKDISIRGYAGSKQELENWLDPCLYVCYEQGSK